MFNKLKNYHSVPDWTRLKGDYIHGYGGFDIYTIKDFEYLEIFFKPLISFNIKPIKINYIEISTNIDPHIDAYPFTAVVNFIIEPADAITSFYSKKESITFENDELYGTGAFPPIKKYDNDDKLEFCDSFTSEAGDFILLDVSKVHGVEINEQKVRRLVTWRWGHFKAEHLLKNINILF